MSSAGPSFLASRLATFQGAIFLPMGIFVPYWALWLDRSGMSAAEIGVLLSLPVLTRLVTGPAAAWIADRSGDTPRVLTLLTIGALASYALFGLAGGFWQFLILALCGGACFTAILPLADDLSLRAAYCHGVDYGRVRVWGSITYIAASALGGLAVAHYPKDIILVMVVGGFVLSVIASFALPNLPRPSGQTTSGRIGPLLRDPAFQTFLIAAALIQASHGVLYSFATLHWEAAGHSTTVIGWLWAESTLIEVGVFAASGTLLRRVGVANLLIIGGAAGIVRWLILGSTTALPLLVVAQALHSLTFAAAHLAAVHFIARTAPPGTTARAQMAYSAVALGIGNGITLFSAGLLYGWLGGAAFYVMAGLSVLGTLGAIGLSRIWIDRST